MLYQDRLGTDARENSQQRTTLYTQQQPDLATRFALPIPGDPAEKGVVGYNIIQQQEQHAFYQQWTGDDFPRFLVIEVQHACPYYDDSCE